MGKAKSNISRIDTSRHYANPEFLILCNDALVGQDQSVSFIRLIDQLNAFALPVTPTRFVIVAQLQCNRNLEFNEFVNAQLTYKFVLVNPKGATESVAEMPLLLNPNIPPAVSRLIVDVSGRFGFSQEGTYQIKLLGRTQQTEFEELAVKALPVMLFVGWPGLYIATFSADSDASISGSGWAILMPDGTIQGGDPTGYDYHGSYKVEGEAVHALLKIRRRDPRAMSILGDLDEFELNLKGQSQSGNITFHGHRLNHPSEKIVVKLERQLTLPGNSSS